MYFAVNPTAPAAMSALSTALAVSRQSTSDIQAYALVDTSFHEGLGKRLRRRYSGRLRDIYAETRLAELSDLSPCLIGLADTGDREWALADLLADCSGRPMLSFLTSALSLDALTLHFRQLVQITTEDELSWPLRFADTRIIPSLLEVLNTDQRTALLQPIEGWWIVSRSGEIGALSTCVNGDSTAKWPERGLVLTDDQFARLVADSEADGLINTLSMAAPEALADRLPAEVFATVSRHCALSDRYGLSGSENRLRLALLALTLPEGATESPAMREILHRAGEGEPLAALIEAQPDDFWEAAHA